MPNFIPLTPIQMEELSRRRQNPAIMRPYKEFLSDFNEDEVGEILLVEGEQKRTEKRRMSIAATSLGKELTWIRPLGSRILFKVS